MRQLKKKAQTFLLIEVRKKCASIPDALPRNEVIHDLSDAGKVCPHDSAVLRHFGNETSEQPDHIPAQVSVLQHVRRKYVCPCCNNYMVPSINLRSRLKNQSRHLVY